MKGDDIVHELLRYGAAIIHESHGPRGVIGPAIRPLWAGAAVAGPCRTVRLAPGDNLGLHIAVEEADPGDVICADCQGATAFGYWGGVMTGFAMERGIAGLVTNCGVRDTDELESRQFPVFSTGRAVQGTVKRHSGEHQVPIVLAGGVIRPGDWIVADIDGAVAVRREAVDATLDKARARVNREAEITAAISGGMSTREALGLP